MQAGALRDRLVFQRRFEKAEPDANGQVQLEWQDMAAASPASVSPVSGGDTVIAGRLSGVTGYRVRCRFQRALADLGTTDRAVDARDATRTFNLKSVLISDRRDWIDIVAETGGPT